MVLALISLKLLQDSRTEVLAKRESKTRGVKTNFGQRIIGQANLFLSMSFSLSNVLKLIFLKQTILPSGHLKNRL